MEWSKIKQKTLQKGGESVKRFLSLKVNIILTSGKLISGWIDTRLGEDLYIKLRGDESRLLQEAVIKIKEVQEQV